MKIPIKIEPHIKKYIDSALDKADVRSNKRIDTKIQEQRLIFKKDIEHYMGALNEAFQDKIDMIVEIVKDKPSRTEMNAGFDDLKQEIRMIRADIAMQNMRIAKCEQR